MAKRERYSYKKRTPESVRRRAEQSSNSYDKLFKDDLDTFSPKEGSYQLRILPPGWKDAEHYGVEIRVHYSVGPDNGQYLCPEKHKNEFCPVCDERRETSDEEERKQLSPKKRVLIWVIDRDHEDRGPLLWSMPWTVDRDVNQQALDPRTGAVLYIDDPEEGYDISFSKEGTGFQTKYIGLKIVRDPSVLSKDDDEMDDWLDFIEDNNLPECLNVFDGKYIQKVFAGAGSSSDDEDEDKVGEKEEVAEKEEEKPRRHRRQTRDEEPEEKKDDKEEDEGPPFETEDESQDEIRSRLRKMRRRRGKDD